MIPTPPPTADAPPLLSPILAVSTRVMLPVIALAALVITLQGHNKPGGGFIGGLILAAAVALHALSFGPHSTRQLLRIHPISIAVLGLLLSSLSGLFSPSVGFLHAQWISLPFPGLDALKLGTPILFDLGVFLVILGSASLMILALLDPPQSPAEAP